MYSFRKLAGYLVTGWYRIIILIIGFLSYYFQPFQLCYMVQIGMIFSHWIVPDYHRKDSYRIISNPSRYVMFHTAVTNHKEYWRTTAISRKIFDTFSAGISGKEKTKTKIFNDDYFLKSTQYAAKGRHEEIHDKS